jgi:ankyrin repeat protein
MGAEPNLKDITGETALDKAVKWGNDDEAAYMHAHGGKCNTQSYP